MLSLEPSRVLRIGPLVEVRSADPRRSEETPPDGQPIWTVGFAGRRRHGPAVDREIGAGA
jgi:hypothetical protein